MIPFSTYSVVGLTNSLKRLRERLTDSNSKHCSVTEEAIANRAHKSGMTMVQSLAKTEKVPISQWTKWGQRMQDQEAAHVNTWSQKRVCGLFNMTWGLEGLVYRACTGTWQEERPGREAEPKHVCCVKGIQIAT